MARQWAHISVLFFPDRSSINSPTSEIWQLWRLSAFPAHHTIPRHTSAVPTRAIVACCIILHSTSESVSRSVKEVTIEVEQEPGSSLHEML